MNFVLQNNLDSLVQMPIYSVGETPMIINMGDNIYTQPNENISNFTNINYYNNTELPNIINMTDINGINQEFFPLIEPSPTIMYNTDIITNDNLDNYVPNYNNNFQIIQPIPTLETNYDNQVFGAIEIPTQIIPSANDLILGVKNNDLNNFYESIEYNDNTLTGYNVEYTNIIQNTHLENKNDAEQPLIVNNSISKINTNIAYQKLRDKNPSIENLSLDIDDYEIKKKLESYELSKSFAIMNDEIPSKIKNQPKLDFQPNINIQADNFDQTIPLTTSHYLVNNELNTTKNNDINNTEQNSITYITESTEDTLGRQVYYSQTKIIPVDQINNNQVQEVEYEYVYEDQGDYLPQQEVLIDPSTIPINAQVQQEIITPEFNLVNAQPMIYQDDSPIATEMTDQQFYLPQQEVLIDPSTIPINAQVQQEIITPEFNLVNAQPMIYQDDSPIATEMTDQQFYLPQQEVLIDPSTIPINAQVQQEIITPEFNLVNVQPMINQDDSPVTTQLADPNQYYTIINQNEIIPSILPQTFNTYNASIEPIVNPLIMPTDGQMFIETPTIPLNYTNQAYIYNTYI